MQKSILNRCPDTLMVLLLCMLFALLAGRSSGQSTFTLKDNAIEDSPNLSIGGTLFGADIYNPNLAFFIEGKLNYRLKKELGWIKANYTLAFGDRLESVTESSTSQDALPANGTQPLRDIGLSLGYNFIKRVDVKLARATFLNRTKSKKITLPLKQYRLYGLHAGYEMFRTIVAQGSTASYTGTIVENSLKGKTVIAGNATPMLNMQIVSLGIHRHYIEHWKVQVNNGGEITDYSSRSVSTLYADFLFGMKILFDDVMVPLNMNAPNSSTITTGNSMNDPYNYYRADINGSYKKMPIGGRIGWEQSVLKSVGLTSCAEIGFRPGIIDPVYNLYIMLKFGLMLNFKAK